ncbi:MAG: hypothetical protein ACPL3C_09955 [Pyrobaculum sp.]
MLSSKEMKRLGIVGYFEKPDGTVVLVVKDRSLVALAVSEVEKKTGRKHIEVEVGEVQLMRLDDFFRPWGGERGIICSPPLGGYTAHHCTGLDNEDHSGRLGILYSTYLDNGEAVKIVKDYVFKPGGPLWWLEVLLAFLTGRDVSNSCDLAIVEDKLKTDRTPVGVLFAGTSNGKYAVACDLSTKLGGRSIGDFKTVYGLVMHVEVDGRDVSFLAYGRRKYEVLGKGSIYVAAFDKLYKFEPVYFMQGEPAELCDVRTGKCKTVYESARPGYSGTPLFAEEDFVS